MDRSYKAIDLVHVHLYSKEGALLDTFNQAPFSYCGMDYYHYKGKTYVGYIDMTYTPSHSYILVKQ